MSEVEEISGSAGDFNVRVIQHPRYIDLNKCIACGLCAEKCPKKVPSEYDAGLVKRKAAYVKYTQAVPLKYAIDDTSCIFLTKGKCKACEKFCPTGAVNFADQKKEIKLNVGAVIVAPGANVYDPGAYDVYGYKALPNVVTSLEFERILSATGPFGGHMIRPSDHKEPKKIAWVQCVGSRDLHPGSQSYCSGVCCTYSVKQAMLAKEHSANGLDAAVFYIDMRTFGKDFERYYNRAKEELGIRFVKSRVANVELNEETGMQVIRYVDEAGRRVEEEFDIVVLSVGLSASAETAKQAQKWGIELNRYNFAETGSFSPVETSRPGIYVCGIFQGPKDIPTSVIDSSAAAGVAGSRLSDVRWTLTKTREIPKEVDVRGEPPRIGVFVCRCGTNIAGTVDVPAVVEFAKGLPGVAHVEENMFSCSQDTQDKMTEVIREHRLNRVVVAACTPKTHEPLFQETLINAGINKYLFEMGNIRNQCSWVHKDDPEKATEKSKDIVRMAVAKARLLEPLQEATMGLMHSALVVGGGVAGMTAAQTMSAQGYRTTLVEKTEVLGGRARQLHETWRGEDIQGYLTELADAVQSDENIDVLLGADITHVDGFVGNFKTTVHQNGTSKVIEHGVTIIASGASEYKPEGYLYGQDPRVVTGLELQQRFVEKDPSLGQGGTAVFIQCVGSRIPERPYCSKVCCTQSIKSALTLKKINPKMDVFIVYRDMRPYGLREDLYREARSAGIGFIRYDFDKGLEVVNESDSLKVSFTDRVLGRRMDIRPDLLVLASAVMPEAENPLAQLYKVPVNADGFFAEAHVKLRPVDFATDGIFLCGLAHAPKPIDESITQAQAAVARAVTVLAMKDIKLGGIISQIQPELCSGCLGCINVCPFGAITFDNQKFVAEINPALCKGCGACAAVCPSEAPLLMGFDNNQIYAQIKGALCA